MSVTYNFMYERALDISVANKDERDQNKALRMHYD